MKNKCTYIHKQTNLVFQHLPLDYTLRTAQEINKNELLNAEHLHLMLKTKQQTCCRSTHLNVSSKIITENIVRFSLRTLLEHKIANMWYFANTLILIAPRTIW